MPVDFRPSETIAAEASRGLEWRREFNRGGTAVGVARARDLANRRMISPDTIRRMVSYFARHEVDKQAEGFRPGEAGYPSAGRIAWALWGGDPGQAWANRISRQLDTQAVGMIHIENKAGRLKLDEQVDKWSVRELVEQINRVFGAEAAQAGLITGEIVNCIENAADTLDIEINSPGGSVLDGYVLYNAIKDMRARGVYVTAHVQLAASMASVIAIAADKIVMLEGARMMIHEASTVTSGDAAKHATQAELLEGISDEIAGIYAARTGTPKDEIRAAMKKETWMDGKQAVAAGFADETFDNKDKDKKTMNILDRLTQPSAAEAQERIVALESQINEHDAVVADFTSKLEVAENALQEASTQLTALKAQIEETAEKLEEAEKTVTEQAEKIEELEKAAEETEEKVANRAAELLAASGHPAPVNINDDNGGMSILDQFNAITNPGERTRFYNANRKAILAAQSRI